MPAASDDLCIQPFGDSGVIAGLDTVDQARANRRCLAVAEALRRQAPAWLIDIVPGIASVAVRFVATTVNEAATRREACRALLAEAFDRLDAGAALPSPREVEIPVCHAPDLAPDLDEVARATGLSPDAVIAAHLASPHRVLMLGFSPGTPYLGGLDPRLALPRRASPRTRVEAGSVGIANGQCVIYPRATPGGWHLIGRTPLRLFDAGRAPPAVLQAGDRVRFVAIGADRFRQLACDP
ncbi:MAG: 5-oxoprolinase subunit PxpB [Chromatiales bacterium]|jgi:KipI family sensor histidine kinase inhibitor|nr:5-oxoprolinase subunit PxpB [Chromatiales bacterium]